MGKFVLHKLVQHPNIKPIFIQFYSKGLKLKVNAELFGNIMVSLNFRNNSIVFFRYCSTITRSACNVEISATKRTELSLDRFQTNFVYLNVNF